MEANVYSPRWFELFLRSIPPEQTWREADFLTRQLPLPASRNVLDLCCGEGRHAAELSRRGYAVTCVDLDHAALVRARQAAPTARFLRLDVRDLRRAIDGRFDAGVCLWQSFGYFDADANAMLLRDVAELLRPGGRLILDVYHRSFFERAAGERTLELGGRRIVERRNVTTGRLRVELTCDGAEMDVFEWQVYAPDELIALGERCGLRPVVACSGFDEAAPPSDRVPRYQVVFQREQG